MKDDYPPPLDKKTSSLPPYISRKPICAVLDAIDGFPAPSIVVLMPRYDEFEAHISLCTCSRTLYGHLLATTLKFMIREVQNEHFSSKRSQID
jgi:hypothetical protein